MIPTATVFSSTVNLVKTIVGAGLLAIPYAFRADGVLVALLLIVLAAVTSGFGLYLLAKSSKTLLNARQSSFFTLCSISYPRLSLVFDFAMFTQCYGVGLSYLVLVGDLFPGVFGGDRNWWILGSLLVVVPLAHLRQFDSLKYSSFLGLIAITYLVIIIVGAFLEGLFMNDNYQESRGEISWFKIRSVRDLVSTFSIIVFAFTGSMNMFSIINELGDNSMRNINKVIRYSIVVATILFVAVGISGYLTFGSNVVGNVLLNFDESTMRVKFADIALGSMSILSFPLLFHPCRIAFNNMIYYVETNYKQFKLSSKAKTESDPFLSEQDNARVISMSVEDEEDRNVLGLGGGSYQSFRRGSMSHAELSEQIDGEISDVPFDGSRFYLVTWGLLIVLYVLALNVRSFALVLSIVGATGSTAISFILPGLFGYKLIGTESLMKGEPVTKTEQMCKYGSIALVFYGLAVTIISLFVIFYYGI